MMERKLGWGCCMILLLFAVAECRAQDADTVAIDPYTFQPLEDRLDWVMNGLMNDYPCPRQRCFLIVARDTFRVIADTSLGFSTPLFMASMYAPGSRLGYFRYLQWGRDLRIGREDFPQTLDATAVPFDDVFYTFLVMWNHVPQQP